MRIIFYIVKKEFIQIFRNRTLLPILFVMPVVQLLVLTYAADFEIKNINLHIVDQDQSAASQDLVAKLAGSEYFRISGNSQDVGQGFEQLEEDHADAVLVFPSGFERKLLRGESPKVQGLINAINGTKAGLAGSYLQAIIADYNLEQIPMQPSGRSMNFINVSFRNWFNPDLDYKIFMAPGILALLATMIALFLTSINVVREKELGTIEQLNVTTIGRMHFIIGKIIPFWIIAVADLIIGYILVRTLFNVPMEGSVLMTLAFANLYLLAMLGLGMLISTISETQQQAMFISWFLMVIFILLSGLFTPIDFMPDWAKAITKLNPVAYFVQFLRMAMLKGSEFRHVSSLFIAMAIYALIINVMAALNYRKTIR